MAVGRIGQYRQKVDMKIYSPTLTGEEYHRNEWPSSLATPEEFASAPLSIQAVFSDLSPNVMMSAVLFRNNHDERQGTKDIKLNPIVWAPWGQSMKKQLSCALSV